MKTRFFAAATLLLVWAATASAHPTPHSHDPDEGATADEHDQHGAPGGHLPASSKNVDLIGKVELTNVAGGIADVGALGNYAYLSAFRPECAGLPGAQGTGVHVVDISNPASPAKVGFLPAEANSYVGEGVHVMHVSIPGFTGDVLVHNNETCDSAQPVTSGFAVWNVTNPLFPVKIGQFGDTTPAVPLQTYHTTHSVQGFTWRGRAYAVAQDNNDLRDVDIFDITPALTGAGPAVLVAEVGLEDWPGAFGAFGNGESVFHHDMQQKVIAGHNYLAVSYWDAGQVLLNVDDPAAPVFVTDSDFSSPDLAGFQISEGNSHQSYWDQNGDFLLSTDEDFSPSRILFEIASGPNAGPYGAGEFSWTPPLSGVFTGNTVFGGSGCLEDANGNGSSDRDDVPTAAATGASVVVFSRGVCFFSHKVETGQLKGYSAVLIGQSHAATRNGLLPNGFTCGSQGHAFTPTAHGLCIGHRAMHLLFDDAPAYVAPEGYAPGGDLPAIGTLGATIRAQGIFDGWGYVRLHDGQTLAEIDSYAIPEALDPAYASGFGNLTVHEVKTDPRAKIDLAYASWYDAGLRVLKFGAGGITEIGHYVAEDGNDFWGTFPLCAGQCLSSDNDKGRGRHNEKRPLLLMSDRDSGLWIFRYTGKE